MTIQHVIELFEQYGLPMMAAVFFCEYLNLPGFPAGIIMPAVGILIGQSQMSLILSIAVSVAAGLAGCLVIYFICYYGGAPLRISCLAKTQNSIILCRNAMRGWKSATDAGCSSAGLSRCCAPLSPSRPDCCACRFGNMSPGRQSGLRSGTPCLSAPVIFSAKRF